MKNSLFLLLILLLVTFNLANAQSTNLNNSKVETFTNDLNHFFELGIDFAKSPSKFSASEWYTTGAIVGGTILLFTIDKNVRTFALSNQTNLNNNLFKFDKFYGSGYTAIFTTALYSYGLFANNSPIRKLGLQASEAFIYSALLTGILKVTIGRRRPNAGENHLAFKPFQFTNNAYQSLPSGHTSVAFAVSTVMANYSSNIYWKIFWYGSASMVGLSRVYHNKHWISDVLLGATVGYLVGNFIVDFSTKGNDNLGIKIIPSFTFNTIGLTIKF